MEPNQSNQSSQGGLTPKATFSLTSGSVFGSNKANITTQTTAPSTNILFAGGQSTLFSPHTGTSGGFLNFSTNQSMLSKQTGLFGQSNNPTINNEKDLKGNQPQPPILPSTKIFQANKAQSQSKNQSQFTNPFACNLNLNKNIQGGSSDNLFKKDTKETTKSIFDNSLINEPFGYKPIKKDQEQNKETKIQKQPQKVLQKNLNIVQTQQDKNKKPMSHELFTSPNIPNLQSQSQSKSQSQSLQQKQKPQSVKPFPTPFAGLSQTQVQTSTQAAPSFFNSSQQKQKQTPLTQTPVLSKTPIFGSFNQGTPQFGLNKQTNQKSFFSGSPAGLFQNIKTQKQQKPLNNQQSKMKQISLFNMNSQTTKSAAQNKPGVSSFGSGTTPFSTDNKNQSQILSKTQYKLSSLFPKIQKPAQSTNQTPSSNLSFSQSNTNKLFQKKQALPTFELSKQKLNQTQNKKTQITKQLQQIKVTQKLTSNNSMFNLCQNKQQPTEQNKSQPSFKLTTEDNVEPSQKNKFTQKKKTEGRERLHTFDLKKGSQKLPNELINKQKIYVPLNKLYTLLSTQQQAQLIQSSAKIVETFHRYLSILNPFQSPPYIQHTPISFITKLQPKQGKNRFLNDFTQAVMNILKASPSCYEPLGKLFYQMLQQLKYSQKMFAGQQLNSVFFSKTNMYKLIDTSIVILDLQNENTTQLICQFLKYYSALISQNLKRVQNSLKIFKKTILYEIILQKSLLMNLRVPQTNQNQIIEMIKNNDNKEITLLTNILINLLQSKQSTTTTLEIISKQCLLRLIPIVDQLQVCLPTKIFQKILLKVLNFEKYQNNTANNQIMNVLQQTNSQIFMPFRVIVCKLGKNKKKIQPYQKNLYQQIDGPQWAGWLSLYLGQQRFDQKQMFYLVKSLKVLKIKDIEQILSKESQINRAIHIMRHSNQIKNFYQSLSAIISTSFQVQKVQKQFFKQERILYDQLRQVASQIRKFPNCQDDIQEIKQIRSKALYLLHTLVILPDRAFLYENAFFDMMGFIDQTSQRCDRICHLIIDILAYFSIKKFDEEIIAKCFEAIISLMQTNATKSFMNLAMNVNSPQLEFFNKNLPKMVTQKICNFLIHLLSSNQFYDTTRTISQIQYLINAYPFRYSLQRYLLLTQNFTTTIPLYWFSSCLKMSLNQTFNPQLINLMLSRLKIYANKDSNVFINSTLYNQNKKTNIPLILASVVDACNSSNFWKSFEDKLQAQIYKVSGRFYLGNRIISEDNDAIDIVDIFYALNLLKTMIELRKIRNFCLKSNPNHFSSILLSKLSCLSELDHHYFEPSQTQFQFSYKKSIPPILCLMSLIAQQYPIINTTASIKIQWNCISIQDIDIQSIKKIHNLLSKSLDFSVIRDILVHPYGFGLYCHENIGSLAMWCLRQILQQIKQTRIEALFYMMLPKNSTQNLVEDYQNLRKQISQNYVKSLLSSIPSNCRNAWNLLTTLSSNPLNKLLAKDIYKIFLQVRPRQLKKPQPYLLIAKYILQQIQSISKTQTTTSISSKISNNLQFIQYILQELSKLDLSKFWQEYQTLKRYKQIATLHQFQRLVLQRKIIQQCQDYQTITIIQQILLKILYQGTSLPGFPKICQSLINVICQTQAIKLSNLICPQKINTLQLTKCNEHIPRLYGVDILQLYILYPALNRQDLIKFQINNVMDWYNNKVQQFQQKTYQFFTVILSIDNNFYCNQSFPTKSHKKSQLFCQYHLPTIPYKSITLFGLNPKQSVSHLKCIQKDLLQKIATIIKKNIPIYNYEIQILRNYQICNMLFLWFKNNYEQDEKNYYYKQLINICYNWIGQIIESPIIIKYLLDIIKVNYNILPNQFINKLKQTIIKTLKSQYMVNNDIKQQLLTIFLLIPPENNQNYLLQIIAEIWKNQENDQYFYNQSRIMYKLCQLYPIQMVKFKILTKSQRINKFQRSSLQNNRYRFDHRTVQNKSWLWVLKIVAILMENGSQSTLVINQVSAFVNKNKHRLLLTLTQGRQQSTSNSKNHDATLLLSLALLDQLQATLQLFIVLTQSKLWVQMNRQLFQTIFYYIMHRTIFIFAYNNIGQKLHKRYIPYSHTQKLMWKLYTNENLPKQNITQIDQGYDIDRITQQYSHKKSLDFSPNIFILAMSIKYNQCLKLWILACTTGMQNSYYIKQYFNRSIITQKKRDNNIKYHLNHWQHINHSIIDILKNLCIKIKDWGKWQNKQDMLNVLYDSINSPQYFLQTGYLYTLVKFPQNQQELITSLGQTFYFVLEFSNLHLISQLYFRRLNLTFSKHIPYVFKDKLFKEITIVEEKLLQNILDKDDPIVQCITIEKKNISEIRCD